MSLSVIGSVLYSATGMFWQIFWALVLGFALSGIVMAFVPSRGISRQLGKAGLKQLGLATFLGAVSSSCSYAAAAMSRSLFARGAHIVTALAFLLASTNLVIELSAALWVMLGWQFVAAEFIGGVILVLAMATLMLFFGPLKAFEEKRGELARSGGQHGSHGGVNADTVADPRTLDGWRAAARFFVSEWKMIGKDIAFGMLAAGAIMRLVPDELWRALFLAGQGESAASRIVENALVGPIVSVASFVCSVGNIPLAAVLYRGGIAFGGVISFIFADLIIIPLILVYRKYYGWRLALWITGVFYASMVIAGVAIQVLFGTLGWIPARQDVPAAHGMDPFADSHTFWLNLAAVFITVAAVRLARSRGAAGSEPESCCH